MTRHILNAPLWVGALLLAGCNTMNHAPTDAQSPWVTKLDLKPDNILVTVNGRPIPRSAIPQQARQPEEQVREILAQRELLRQEAEKANLQADPAVREKLDNAVRMTLSQAAAERFIQTAPISDADIHQAYAEYAAAASKSEYRVRHILVDSERKAQDIIARLHKGSSFEALAKKLSRDEGTRDKGGELGWFAEHQVVEAFATAVAALKDGETSTTPVQTQFGWHVIQREESREQQAPSLDDVKDSLRTKLQSHKFQQHLEELRKNASVEVAGVPVKPVEIKPVSPHAH